MIITNDKLDAELTPEILRAFGFSNSESYEYYKNIKGILFVYSPYNKGVEVRDIHERTFKRVNTLVQLKKYINSFLQRLDISIKRSSFIWTTNDNFYFKLIYITYMILNVQAEYTNYGIKFTYKGKTYRIATNKSIKNVKVYTNCKDYIKFLKELDKTDKKFSFEL